MTKGDLISRQAVLDIWHTSYSNNREENEEIQYKKIAFELPSVENKGEWIEVVTERFPNGEKRMWHYECSTCSTGEPPCPINKEHWDFCPNCGADMRGAE